MKIEIAAYFRSNNGQVWYEQRLVDENHIAQVGEKYDGAHEPTGRTQIELVTGSKLTVNRPFYVVRAALRPDLTPRQRLDEATSHEAALVMLAAAPVAELALEALAEEEGGDDDAP